MPGKSSRRWLREHFTDPYVKLAQQKGYRSRAVFKLLEIQERNHLFKSGMTIVDLGAAPGGWCQLLTEWVKPGGKVIALDILPMSPLPGVDFILGDFSTEETLQLLLQRVNAQKDKEHVVDWVVSDMAPNMSGNEQVDIPRAMYLTELALDFALKVIKTNGGFLTKVFQGEGVDQLLTTMKRHFKTVVIRKPKASRGRSREIYVVAKGLKHTHS